MASVASTLDRIKQDLRPFLPDSSIESACRQAGHRWRERDLGPVRTVHLFVLQVLCFNSAMTHLRHLAKAANYTSKLGQEWGLDTPVRRRVPFSPSRLIRPYPRNRPGPTLHITP